MSVLMKVFNYLKDIKDYKVSFNALMNKEFNNINDGEINIIKNSLKSIVNKYYFLMWEQEKLFPIENEDLKDYYICALGQYHFVHGVSDEDILINMKLDVPSFNLDVDIQKMYDSIVSLNRKTLELSKRESEVLVKKIAINYSYPEWVVKMICKHFGLKKGYKAIAVSRKVTKLMVNCNLFLTNADKILASHPDLFEKGTLAKNSLRYLGKEKIINLDLFEKNNIFVEDEINQLLVEKLDLRPGDDVLFIGNDKGSIPLDIAIQIRDVGNIHVACPNAICSKSIDNITRRFKIHSINKFDSKVDLLLTHIDKESCDKILFIADSSSLGLVRKNPAVLLTLKRDDLDNIINKQKNELEEVSTFVRKGGLLEYAVYTYNKKETLLQIEDFLKNHTDFELLEERTVLSHEAMSDGAYFAVLRKKND